MPTATTLKKNTLQVNKSKKRPDGSSKLNIEDDLEDWKKSKQILKPKDQVELSDLELKEVIPRFLTSANSQLSTNQVIFCYHTGTFEPIPQQSNVVVAFEQKGTYIHIHTDAAREQMFSMGIDPEAYEAQLMEETEEQAIDLEATVEQLVVPEGTETQGEGEEGGDEAAEGTGGEGAEGAEAAESQAQEKDADAEDAPVAGVGKKLTNQFNFCERAALTYKHPVRAQETQTIPPPMDTFSANILQWVIYDGYLEDYSEQQAEKERERERREKEKAPISRAAAVAAAVAASAAAKRIGGRTQLSEAVQGRVFECWKVLERMINQNTYDEIAKDYRYWEDPSDEYREGEGSLLPLWKFCFEKTKKTTVTDICWNPWYYDLFIVCFGSLEFIKPISEGAVCLFTIKNPSYPEHICITEASALCADIHPQYPYMVVVGLYDGSVNVFNVQATCKKTAFRSNAVRNKHYGIIWEVKWAPDLPDGEMNFYTVAADGKINNWVLMQNELSMTTVIVLYLQINPAPGPDGTLMKLKSCASCVVFHPKKPLIYMVGTEEGYIYKCSTNYSSMFLMTYKAHSMPVYRINFNKYNPDIFISCSGDWRIKIWEDNRAEPLFVFDVGSVVGDVKWAPYSSTVFAAVCCDGKVYVFDININKYKPICVQAVVSRKRNKLTRIDFNYKLPILIVGDDKGTVTTLKLSPNLRIPCKAPKKMQHLDQWALQCLKLDKLLSLVREPPVLSQPEDKPISVDD